MLFCGQSQASKAAPSQRGNTAFNFVVSVHPLESIFAHIQQALSILTARNEYNIQFQQQKLQPGDIDERDTSPGGEGFILAFSTLDKRRQPLVGWIRVVREFDCPIIDELAAQGVKADKAFIVKFDRSQGDPLAFRVLQKAVVDVCPPDLLVAR